MTASRPLIIAGAGIGGLSAALALAARGLRVAVFEQASGIADAGAGIQLSPNASRILIALGLAPQLQSFIVLPTELRVRNAGNGRVVTQVPLGSAETRYGAPYWLIHRGDLHRVLMNAARAHPLVTLRVGTRIEEFAVHHDGVSVSTLSCGRAAEERGTGLIAADGLWSQLRRRLGHRQEPRFAGHTAWRALVPASAIPPELRAAAVSLWLGRDAHLVHYPVRGGSLVNVVAIVHDEWREPGWSTLGAHSDLLARFGAEAWQEPMRALVAGTQSWSKWALYDAAPFAPWGKDRVTLLGDAAHPMLPYLAQGAAAAIEDAAVLARALSQMPADPARAMRLYERERGRRTARMQRAARANGRLYHLGSFGARMRTLALRALGGRRMLARYDWLYGWKSG